MRWKVHSERPLYTDDWLQISMAHVELPDGRHLGHRLIRTPHAAGAVVQDAGRVLLLWRHRFITGTWGFEIPMGKIEAGESPEAAAAREVEEETGWRPGPLRRLVGVETANGLCDSRHHLFYAAGATYMGPPSDPSEAERVEWVPLTRIREMIARGEIVSAPTALGLLYVLAEGCGCSSGA
ncbi:NUDIX hydrolase [Nonomuraea sp. NPDC049158]|uniref:NUDIX hydrolase n=1 Tax=Nonomuraea sp. NPDC049158 TaxID=3155649 RepID=UPI0033E0952B